MASIHTVSRFLVLVLAASCGIVGVAHAAAAAASAPPAKAAKPAAAAKPKAAASAPDARARLLSPAELRDCKEKEANVMKLSEQARQEKAALETEKAEIASSGTTLGQEITTLDKTDPEAVNAYNAKVGARDKLIEGYQSKVGAFNQKADAVNATRDAYAVQCDKRRYDERDLNDIKRKK